MSSSTAPIGPRPRVGSHEARLLQAHLQRLRSWSPDAHVRVLVRDRALGVFSAPPMGVLGFIALPLAGRDGVAQDETVRVDVLLDGIVDTPAAGAEIAIPQGGTGPAELAVLPPEDGWQLPIAGISGDLVPAVDDAVAEFRMRAPLSPSTESLAAEIWERSSFGGLPLRALHAARLLGFLLPDASRVTASTGLGWKRLSTVRGQVFLRDPRAFDRPRLTVVR